MALPELARSERQAPAPSALPALAVQPLRQAGRMTALRYRVTGTDTVLDRFAPSTERLAVRYRILDPAPSPSLAPRMAYAGSTASGTLPLTFASGTRVLVTADRPEPSLACRYRFGAVRVELP
jgi:hypothetical protein